MKSLKDLDYLFENPTKTPSGWLGQISCELEFLDNMSTEYMIAGGFARDIFFGVSPRDIDIELFGFDNHLALKQTFGKLHDLLEAKGRVDEVYDSTGYVGRNNISAVIKTKTGVDYIFNSPEVKTKDDALNNFDFNLNLFCFDVITGLVRFEGPTKTLGILIPVKPLEELSSDRITYMSQKAKDFGWEVPSVKAWSNIIPLKSQAQLRDYLL